jgi:hypothetical protein
LWSERDLCIVLVPPLGGPRRPGPWRGPSKHTAHRDVCLFVEGSKRHLVADFADVVGAADVAQPVLTRRKAEVGRWRLYIPGGGRCLRHRRPGLYGQAGDSIHKGHGQRLEFAGRRNTGLLSPAISISKQIRRGSMLDRDVVALLRNGENVPCRVALSS